VVISDWFYIKPIANRRQRQAQAVANTGESETERRSSPAVYAPLLPSSSAAEGDVTAGSSLVATTSSLLSSTVVGMSATDHTSASTSDSGDGDATVLYNSNGLSTGDVVV